jgi:DNA-binding NtrC family response regulator
METKTILLAHDKKEKRETYRKMLIEAGKGWSVETASCGEEAISKAQSPDVCVAVLDVLMPETKKDEEKGLFNQQGGIYALERITALRGYLPIIMFSNDELTHDVLDKARAFRIFDYLVRSEKNFDYKFLNRVGHAVEMYGHRRDMLRIPSDIIFRSAAMERVVLMAREAAKTDAPVLIVGETGSGKELMAHEVHKYSKRADRIFLTVNCAALPETLVESEMFGHVEGAFTGAVRKRKGKLEQADGGTLFLDEVGDMTPMSQAKLLRAIEKHEYQPVGGEETKTADVRIICATNRDLGQMVAEGKFRDDLYYRICFEKIHVPPLRERKEDIVVLMEHFVAQNCRKMQRENAEVTEDVNRHLQSLPLNGNVRELQAIAEAATSRLGASEREITEFHLEPALFRAPQERNAQQQNLFPSEGTIDAALCGRKVVLDDAVEKFKFVLIDAALKKSNNVAEKAAALLGANPHTIRRYIREREKGGAANA